MMIATASNGRRRTGRMMGRRKKIKVAWGGCTENGQELTRKKERKKKKKTGPEVDCKQGSFFVIIFLT